MKAPKGAVLEDGTNRPGIREAHAKLDFCARIPRSRRSMDARFGGEAYSALPKDGRCGADSGPSRADHSKSAIRPIEASKAAVGDARKTSTPAGRCARILLKNSEIEQRRKSRFRTRRIISADSPYGRAYGRVAGGKAGRSAEPLRNFSSRLPAVS